MSETIKRKLNEGAKLGYCLSRLHWSPAVLAEVLDIETYTVRHWLAGRSMIPPAVLAWLLLLTELHERHPPPEKPPL